MAGVYAPAMPISETRSPWGTPHRVRIFSSMKMNADGCRELKCDCGWSDYGSADQAEDAAQRHEQGRPGAWTEWYEALPDCPECGGKQGTRRVNETCGACLAYEAAS